jgi:hypothetical protein
MPYIVFDFCIDFVFQSLNILWQYISVSSLQVFAGLLFQVALLNFNDCGLYFYVFPKYHHQAQKILYSRTCYGGKNPFVISMSDLSPDLIIRLLDSRKDYILYRVVERFIELHDQGFLAPHKKRRYPWLFHP